MQRQEGLVLVPVQAAVTAEDLALLEVLQDLDVGCGEVSVAAGN